MPGWFQVTQGSAEADPVMVVGNTGPDTGGVRAVVVRAIGESGSPAGVVIGLLGRMPVFPVGVVNEDRTLGSVKIVVVVHIGLSLPEIGQHLPETPAVVAQRGPVVEVFGIPTVEARCVDGAGAAGYLAPGHRHIRIGIGGAGHVLPAVAAIQQGYWMAGKCAQGRRVPAGVVPELDIIGKVLKFRIVRAGLKEQHRHPWVLRQPGCQYAACGNRRQQ